MVTRGLVGLMLLSVACIGCTDSSTPNDALDGGSPVVGVNGPLAGEIWVTEKFGTERVNLQTGDAIKVSEERAYPSRDGGVYVEFLKDVGQVDGNCSVIQNDTHQINLIDTRSLEVLNSFVLDRDIQGPLRLSPDGKRIAMRVAAVANELCGTNNSDFRVSVFSTDGKELFRASDGDGTSLGIKSYDWHPDGRLVIVLYVEETDEFEIQIESTPGSFRFQTLLEFESSKDIAFYTGLRIGPTGNDAVMEGVYETAPTLSGFTYREARVFYFNLFEDTESPALFQQSNEDTVNSPVFSPDGNYIMVTYGYIGGGLVNYTVVPDLQPEFGVELMPVILPASTNSLSYVVTVGIRNQPMPPESYSETIRPVFAKRFSSGELSAVGFYPIDGYTWTPVID